VTQAVFRLADVSAIPAFFGRHTGVDPTAGHRRSVVFEIFKGGEKFAGREIPSVNFGENRFCIGLTDGASRWNRPREGVQRSILCIAFASRSLLEHAAQMISKPQLAASIARSIDRFVVPLKQTLRIRE